MKQRIFVSGVQKELAAERRAVKELVEGDYLLKEHFSVFLFEDSPAKSRPANRVYIEEVDKCDIYLCIIGEQYGAMDKSGKSATEKEYDKAVKEDKKCLVYLKQASKREKKTELFIKKTRDAECGRVYDRFGNTQELGGDVYESLIDILRDDGVVSHSVFDERICKGVDLSDIDITKVRWFLATAKAKGRFPYGEGTPVKEAFKHLKLFNKGSLTNAAILLFGKDPQKYHLQAVTKCLKVAGTEIEKPFENFQIYGGNIFEQADRAAAFVIDSLRNPVIQKSGTVAVDRPVEMPVFVISEAIINAIAHRDYNPAAGVQVHVLADRIEIFNPGRLPDQLSIADLSRSHESFPGNPLIADVFYKANYIQQAGSGTKEMARQCKASSLPNPFFESHRGQFKTIIYRDIFTKDMLEKSELSERQIMAFKFLKESGRISNKEYINITGASRITATRDLSKLVKLGLLKRIGSGKRDFAYELNFRNDAKDAKMMQKQKDAKDAKKKQK